MIKKAFRRLAFLYHPDKYPDNQLKHKQFLLIQEAYATLSDPEKRRRYDYEWGLNFSYKTETHISPETLLAKLRQCFQEKHINKTLHMDDNELSNFLMEQLKDQNMIVFMAEADALQMRTLADTVLALAQRLPRPFRKKVFEKLTAHLGNELPELGPEIEEINHQQRFEDWYYRNRLIIPMVVGIVLCLLMYWYAKK